jgi:hypothetical protein
MLAARSQESAHARIESDVPDLRVRHRPNKAFNMISRHRGKSERNSRVETLRTLAQCCAKVFPFSQHVTQIFQCLDVGSFSSFRKKMDRRLVLGNNNSAGVFIQRIVGVIEHILLEFNFFLFDEVKFAGWRGKIWRNHPHETRNQSLARLINRSVQIRFNKNNILRQFGFHQGLVD